MESALWQSLLWPGIGTGLSAAMIAFVIARFLVPRLPEPVTELGDDFVKPPYRSLLHPKVVIPSMVAALLAGTLAPLTGPMMWATVALAGAGAALVVVDAHTTYLPYRLHLITAAAVGATAVVGVVLAAPSNGWGSIALGAAFGLVASHALFWLIWRFGDGFGYGDVRLAGLVGAYAGAMGIQPWWTSLMASVVTGAVVALGVLVWRRRHPSPLGTAFPYGPALWVGPFLALLVS